MNSAFRHWYCSGAPWIWFTAGAISISVLLVIWLILLITTNGLLHFHARDLFQAHLIPEEQSIIGEIVHRETVSAARLESAGIDLGETPQRSYTRLLVKVGNREIYGSDFRWVLAEQLAKLRYPDDIFRIERSEWGNFYGFIVALEDAGERTHVALPDALAKERQTLWRAVAEQLKQAQAWRAQKLHLTKDEIGAINFQFEKLRLETRRLELDGRLDVIAQERLSEARLYWQQRYNVLAAELRAIDTKLARAHIVVQTAEGTMHTLPLAKVLTIFQPNRAGFIEKSKFYFYKLWEFISEEPREANTEGGIYPAIFGTIMMVFVMTILVTPLGIIAAVYLREYARQNWITRMVRISVNNLAGIPSIVYGMFGLGFFVYWIGGNIDRWFYAESLPAPTFGSGGLLWASFTLALLTMPVVIVATEEGLARIPRSMREGSLALGATRSETLWRLILPVTSPALMTGMILAIARAAGEVAPLMLVGVVKLAPSLPFDGYPPFLHLERKFMHLGFHIYDVGFQSPNVEAARPLVYATALLLILLIAALNFGAVALRNRLRERYQALEQ